jgi:hypothetical protein
MDKETTTEWDSQTQLLISADDNTSSKLVTVSVHTTEAMHAIPMDD